ncbi:crinkler family protein [Plasmopara halstedii]|uniref:Crinkler family protein n=1 Tax=Plasmopara halstedii TaxID=4781 RepID=A0A0N7L6J5_PLAHL|nr:crinkler family protein [Plasmopara halstedii]CEG44451.1 crinkler family protein [Plasmopara halstedii]|eukprot:XP_024580820.1 crinkler family protein [Plasmopara halstedii]
MPIDLSTLDPQVQLKMWKSVVRVFSEVECSGTAVVVDETSTHLYLLTNLYISQSVSEMPPPNENMLWTLMLQSNHVFTDGSDAIVVYFG